MTYVYILRSLEYFDRYYVGVTAELRSRLQKHNAGEVNALPRSAPLLRRPLARQLLCVGDLCRRHSHGETISAPGGAGAGATTRVAPTAGRCWRTPLAHRALLTGLVVRRTFSAFSSSAGAGRPQGSPLHHPYGGTNPLLSLFTQF